MYDLLLASGSASCEITYETGGTICYGHRVLHPVRSHTRQFVASIFVVLWGHGKKYDLLPLVFVVLWGHGKKYDLLPLFFGVCVGECKKYD